MYSTTFSVLYGYSLALGLLEGIGWSITGWSVVVTVLYLVIATFLLMANVQRVPAAGIRAFLDDSYEDLYLDASPDAVGERPWAAVLLHAAAVWIIVFGCTVGVWFQYLPVLDPDQYLTYAGYVVLVPPIVASIPLKLARR